MNRMCSGDHSTPISHFRALINRKLRYKTSKACAIERKGRCTWSMRACYGSIQASVCFAYLLHVCWNITQRTKPVAPLHRRRRRVFNLTNSRLRINALLSYLERTFQFCFKRKASPTFFQVRFVRKGWSAASLDSDLKWKFSVLCGRSRLGTSSVLSDSSIYDSSVPCLRIIVWK